VANPRRIQQRSLRADSSGPVASIPGGFDVDAHAPDLGLLCGVRNLLTEAGAPTEVVGSFDGVTDPGKILQRLGDAGMLPSPEQSLAIVLEGWRPLLAGDSTALEAELCGLEFLAILRSAAADPAEVPLVLAQLVTQTERLASPEALALLRVLAVVGPPQVRPAATAGAERLVAAGLEDFPWVDQLGAPEVGPAFGYGDDSREVLLLIFTYDGDRHAVGVLVDHDRGGGVKDCWVTDQVAELREAYAEAATQDGLALIDRSSSEARAIVERALRQPACPADPEQVEDVDTYLDLLRLRVALLP
jgi:hypothetical protein